MAEKFHMAKNGERSCSGHGGESVLGYPGTSNDAAHIDGKRKKSRFIVVPSHVDRIEIEDAAGETCTAVPQNDAAGR